MSTNDSYYLLGPIEPQQEFVLVYGRNKVLYVLTQDSTEDLIFDPRNTAKPLVLKATEHAPGIFMTFTEEEKTKYVDGTKIVNSTETQTPIIQRTTEAENFGVFLAGIHYDFTDKKGNRLNWKTFEADQSTVTEGRSTDILMSNGSPVVNEQEELIRAIPIEWFLSDSCGTTTTGAEAVVVIEAVWVSESGNVPKGFTNKDDCETGFRYNYCAPKVECGGKCKGLCVTTGDICFFDGSKESYSCEQEVPDREKPWWQQEWFIALAIVFGVGLALVIVWLAFRHK